MCAVSQLDRPPRRYAGTGRHVHRPFVDLPGRPARRPGPRRGGHRCVDRAIDASAQVDRWTCRSPRCRGGLRARRAGRSGGGDARGARGQLCRRAARPRSWRPCSRPPPWSAGRRATSNRRARSSPKPSRCTATTAGSPVWCGFRWPRHWSSNAVMWRPLSIARPRGRGGHRARRGTRAALAAVRTGAGVPGERRSLHELDPRPGGPESGPGVDLHVPCRPLPGDGCRSAGRGRGDVDAAGLGALLAAAEAIRTRGDRPSRLRYDASSPRCTNVTFGAASAAGDPLDAAAATRYALALLDGGRLLAGQPGIV